MCPAIHDKGYSEMATSQQNGVGVGGAAVANGKCVEKKELETSLDWEDFEVDIGWGTMRGKMKGSGPELILGVHGWLDNANTFDLFAPYLPKHYRFLSLDLPGHGRSDHFPPGFIYDPRGYMVAIRRTVAAIGWQRFIYLGHSMGAVVGIMYTSVFPEDVKALISIDIIKPWSLTPKKQPAALKKYVLEYFDNEKKSAQPSLVYGEEELVKKIIEGSKSLDDRGARILLQRGARKVETGGWMLTRDLRVKTFFIGFISFDEWVEMAKAITCPLLIIRARDGHTYEPEDRYKVMLEAFKQDCQHFHYHEMDGKHHVHLTDADSVASLVTPLLGKLEELETLVTIP